MIVEVDKDELIGAISEFLDNKPKYADEVNMFVLGGELTVDLNNLQFGAIVRINDSLFVKTDDDLWQTVEGYKVVTYQLVNMINDEGSCTLVSNTAV